MWQTTIALARGARNNDGNDLDGEFASEREDVGLWNTLSTHFADPPN